MTLSAGTIGKLCRYEQAVWREAMGEHANLRQGRYGKSWGASAVTSDVLMLCCSLCCLQELATGVFTLKCMG